MMATPVAACPNCSAPLTFVWSGSVQTVCPHCRSIIVRHDIDLAKVGEVSDPPPETSPIQLGTTGRFDDRPFTVIGRIAYEFGEGVWSEWHIVFDDQRTGWLSDAQLRYAVYQRVSDDVKVPAAADLKVGTDIRWGSHDLEVATIADARYRGVEGELPFESWDREQERFADLTSASGELGTIDYSETPPSLYVGRSVSFKALRLKNLREVDRSREVPVGALQCRHCGAPLELRAAGHSQAVVCGHCGTIADVTGANVTIQQAASRGLRVTPKIPLGSSGDWQGARYEVVGFQQREINVEGIPYAWDEYVLFSPEQGFRYLSEYHGHWNDITVLDKAPDGRGKGRSAARELNGRTFVHFQTAFAHTTFVLGEFPWRVRVGEGWNVRDFTSPPFVLSSEGSPKDATWSLGTYVDGADLWRAFSVPGAVPRPIGVYVNQPSPYAGQSVWYWKTFAVLFVLLLSVMAFRALTSSRTVFEQQYVFDPGSPSPVFVTEPFTLDGRPSNVAVSLRADDLSNNWIFLGMALINEETNVGLDFGRELDYFVGVEDGEAWSSGSRRGRAVLASVPAGRYYFRVEPEGDPASRARVGYAITVQRDVPVWGFYMLALFLLLLPLPIMMWREHVFERRRWAESDYGDDGDDD